MVCQALEKQKRLGKRAKGEDDDAGSSDAGSPAVPGRSPLWDQEASKERKEEMGTFWWFSSSALTSLLSVTGTHLNILRDVSPTVTHFFSLKERHFSEVIKQCSTFCCAFTCVVLVLANHSFQLQCL